MQSVYHMFLYNFLFQINAYDKASNKLNVVVFHLLIALYPFYPYIK